MSVRSSNSLNLAIDNFILMQLKKKYSRQIKEQSEQSGLCHDLQAVV